VTAAGPGRERRAKPQILIKEGVIASIGVSATDLSLTDLSL
jgi:hypothetical protein